MVPARKVTMSGSPNLYDLHPVVHIAFHGSITDLRCVNEI